MAIATPIVQKQNLSERIFEVLRDLILRGEIRPGDRIVEAPLAAKLNVSRAPLREALLLLAQHGFVTIRPNRGAFVTRLSATDLEETFEIRQVLEINAAIKLHARMTPEIERRLKSALEELRYAAEERDLMQFTEADFSFHKTLWELAGNKQISKILTDISARYFRYEQIRKPTLASDFDYDGIFEFHQRMVDRMLNGSKQEVESIFSQHFVVFLQFAMVHFVEQYSSNAPTGQ